MPNAKTRPLIVTLTAALCLVALAPARGGILGFGDLGKANKAFEAGRLDEALPIYQQILAENKTWNEKRGEAAWHIALIRLGGGEGLKDIDAGCSLVGELLRAYSQQPHEVAIRGILRLCQTADAALKTVTDLQRKVSSAQQKVEQQQQAADKARSERDRARRHAAELEKRLQRTQAELARKDALLQGLTGTLIGQPGGRVRH
jgi:hypothetical protein